MSPCPQCGSLQLRRSHSRGIVEKFLRNFNQRAYRCKDCGWRGLIKGQGGNKRPRGFSLKGYSLGKLAFIGVLLIITIYILIYLVR